VFINDIKFFIGSLVI